MHRRIIIKRSLSEQALWARFSFKQAHLVHSFSVVLGGAQRLFFSVCLRQIHHRLQSGSARFVDNLRPWAETDTHRGALESAAPEHNDPREHGYSETRQADIVEVVSHQQFIVSLPWVYLVFSLRFLLPNPCKLPMLCLSLAKALPYYNHLSIVLPLTRMHVLFQSMTS